MHHSHRRGTTREIGILYENKAEAYLRHQQYLILEKNVFYRWGEIDLVAVDVEAGELVFVEVRARMEGAMVKAMETITHHKQLRLRRAINTYLVSPQYERLDLKLSGARIDLIAFEGEVISHFKNFISG